MYHWFQLILCLYFLLFHTRLFLPKTPSTSPPHLHPHPFNPSWSLSFSLPPAHHRFRFRHQQSTKPLRCPRHRSHRHLHQNQRGLSDIPLLWQDDNEGANRRQRHGCDDKVDVSDTMAGFDAARYEQGTVAVVGGSVWQGATTDLLDTGTHGVFATKRVEAGSCLVWHTVGWRENGWPAVCTMVVSSRWCAAINFFCVRSFTYTAQWTK